MKNYYNVNGICQLNDINCIVTDGNLHCKQCKAGFYTKKYELDDLAGKSDDESRFFC